MGKYLICPRCGSKMSVVKAIPRGTVLLTANRCPKCRKTNRVPLKFEDRRFWIDDVRESFFTCDICGTSNKDNISKHYLSNMDRVAYWYYYGDIRKITFRCKNCNHRRVKVTTAEFWIDLRPALSEDKAAEMIDIVPIEGELKCPNCDNPIKKEYKICPNCGYKLVCESCGAPIIPGANFCSNCGERVKSVALKIESRERKLECPSCHEPIKEDQIFCIRCGQELKCDKCGAELIEDAYFCSECGDPVRRGEPDFIK